ncbi:MAG: ABC transporter permease [Chloroflexi bacterium]|nr:ABC transporter permease [Chloroflexota bacterium]
MLAEVSRSAGLWRIWVRLGVQDVRMRFRRSAIGLGWIFLNLAIMVLAVGFVYGNLFGQDMGTFIPYLTISLVAWGYITNSIVEGGNAFTSSEGYIKQISLPIYVYVLRFFVSITLVSSISLIVYLAIALVYGVSFAPGTLWVAPGILILMITSLLLITIFAYINARFRDAAHLASVAMQVMFYVTPVIFPAELLRQRGLSPVIDLNPMYHLLQVIRAPLLAGEPADSFSYLFCAIVIGALTLFAAWVMKTYRRRIVFAL